MTTDDGKEEGKGRDGGSVTRDYKRGIGLRA